jgi:hypothetical protein
MRTAEKFIFITILLFGLTFSHLLYAQSPDFIEEVIYDEVTIEPVAFAQIELKLKHLNIYSNSEGTFRLPRNSDLQSDSIIITAIGFNKYSISSQKLIDEEIKKIYLTPSNRSQNVKVSARDERLNSISILRRAIDNLRATYPVKPFSYISYYRDYLQKDSSYINLNEAIIQTFDKGFPGTSDSNIYKVLDFRKNTDFTRMELEPANTEPESISLNVFYKPIPESEYHDQDGNEFLIISAQDPIRNYNKKCFPLAGILSENFIDNHNFSPPSEILNDKLRLVKIAFNGKTGIIGDSLLVSGSIYIQPDNYSIHKLDYSCYNNAKGKRLKKLFGINVEYGSDYAMDSLMHLKYISVSRFHKVFEMGDRSYFRLLNSFWNSVTNINPTLTLCFNNKVDQSTAIQKENFLIRIGKREIHIKNVQVVGENIYLRFNKEVAKEIKDSCEVFVRLLKDQYGNVFRNRTPVDIYQYGEIFVQEFNNSSSFQDSTVINDLSSVRDSIPFTLKKERYWMNTPKNIINIK